MPTSPRNLVVIGAQNALVNNVHMPSPPITGQFSLADTDTKALSTIKEDLKDKVDTLSPSSLSTNMGLNNILSGVMSTFGRVDAVCHIPDLPAPQKFSETKPGEFEEKIIAPARAISAAIRLFSDQMVKQMDDMDLSEAKLANPSFIQVFGMGAQYGDPGAYSQHVAQSMALAAAKATTIDLAALRIRTNSIIAVRPRAENEEPWLKQRTPLGRHSYAEEIAETALFLAEKGGANMTGQSIILDGGRSNLNGIYTQDDLEN